VEQEELAAARDGFESSAAELLDETLARQIADDDRAAPRGDRDRLDLPAAEASIQDLSHDLKLRELWHGRWASGRGGPDYTQEAAEENPVSTCILDVGSAQW
jgi:hypothetical protein